MISVECLRKSFQISDLIFSSEKREKLFTFNLNKQKSELLTVGESSVALQLFVKWMEKKFGKMFQISASEMKIIRTAKEWKNERRKQFISNILFSDSVNFDWNAFILK